MPMLECFYYLKEAHYLNKKFCNIEFNNLFMLFLLWTKSFSFIIGIFFETTFLDINNLLKNTQKKIWKWQNHQGHSVLTRRK